MNNTNRELLDLFEVAEDPISGKAAVIYTDSELDTWTSSGVTKELPESGSPSRNGKSASLRGATRPLLRRRGPAQPGAAR